MFSSVLKSAFVLASLMVSSQTLVAQAPDWVKQDMSLLPVETVSSQQGTGRAFGIPWRPPGFSIPDEIGNQVPDRGMAVDDTLDVAATTSVDATPSRWESASAEGYRENPASRSAFKQFPTSQVDSDRRPITQELRVPATIHCVPPRTVWPPGPAVNGRPVPAPHYAIPVPVVPYVPQSQITKRAYSYGNFGAQSYPLFSRQTGSMHQSTTWSW